LAHATACLPHEACGLLAGQDGRAERLFPIENVLHSPVAYEMEPQQQVRAMLAIEDGGLELLAIYHSHPDGPPRPSPSDVAQAYYPDTVYLILSLAGGRPALRGYMIRDGRFDEIALSWDD